MFQRMNYPMHNNGKSGSYDYYVVVMDKLALARHITETLHRKQA